MRKVQGWLVMGMCVAVAGCDRVKDDQTQGEATVAIAEGAVLPVPEGTAVDTVAPFAGVWDVTTLQGHLERRGVVTSDMGAIRHPALAPPGVRLRSAAGDLQVFVYADAGARARDIAALDTLALRSAPNGERLSLVAGDNVAVLVAPHDTSLRQAVQGVFERRRQ